MFVLLKICAVAETKRLRDFTEADQYNRVNFYLQYPTVSWYVKALPGHTFLQHLLPSLLQLDFHIHASRQIQLHQCIDSLVGWINDVHQTLVRTDFELIARSLVDVRRTQNVETLDTCWQWHGTLDDSAGALCCFDDFQCGLVDQAIVECFQADTDFLARN